MKYVSCCCASEAADECITPLRPPIMNMNINPMAKSMGVEAARCRTAEDLVKALDAGLHNEGPYLIEVAI